VDFALLIGSTSSSRFWIASADNSGVRALGSFTRPPGARIRPLEMRAASLLSPSGPAREFESVMDFLSCGPALNSIYALCFPNFLAVVPTYFLGFDDDAHRGACMARRSPIYGKGDAEHTQEPVSLISAEDFATIVQKLNAEIPSLTRAEVIVKMAQIVAAVGDGHTNIYPTRDPKIEQMTGSRLQSGCPPG